LERANAQEFGNKDFLKIKDRKFLERANAQEFRNKDF